jgi:ribosomal protein S14
MWSSLIGAALAAASLGVLPVGHPTPGPPHGAVVHGTAQGWTSTDALERCLGRGTPDALERRLVHCRNAASGSITPVAARRAVVPPTLRARPTTVDIAMRACLGSGRADTLERKVPHCRTAVARTAEVQQELARCLGTGTPDALERRVPACRARLHAADADR